VTSCWQEALARLQAQVSLAGTSLGCPMDLQAIPLLCLLVGICRLGWSSKFLFGPDVWDWFGLCHKNGQSARKCWVTLWGTMREIRQCQEVLGSTPWEWGTLHSQGSSLWRTLHRRCVYSPSQMNNSCLKFYQIFMLGKESFRELESYPWFPPRSRTSNPIHSWSLPLHNKAIESQ
jgi:hypothetical protein